MKSLATLLLVMISYGSSQGQAVDLETKIGTYFSGVLAVGGGLGAKDDKIGLGTEAGIGYGYHRKRFFFDAAATWCYLSVALKSQVVNVPQQADNYFLTNQNYINSPLSVTVLAKPEAKYAPYLTLGINWLHRIRLKEFSGYYEDTDIIMTAEGRFRKSIVAPFVELGVHEYLPQVRRTRYQFIGIRYILYPTMYEGTFSNTPILPPSGTHGPTVTGSASVKGGVLCFVLRGQIP